MSVQPATPSSSDPSHRFPPGDYKEFVPGALQHNTTRMPTSRYPRPRVPLNLNNPGYQPQRPKFYYSRPLAPQFIPRVRPRYPPRPRGMIPPHYAAPPGRFPLPATPSIPQAKPPESEPAKECICERPETMIICQRCGSELFGRIQRECPAHPKCIQLMDYRECASEHCRSIQLVEIPSIASEGST